MLSVPGSCSCGVGNFYSDGIDTQPDPRAAGESLLIGKSASGRLEVTQGGVVENAYGYIVFVSCSGSQWNKWVNLAVAIWMQQE